MSITIESTTTGFVVIVQYENRRETYLTNNIEEANFIADNYA